MAESPLEQFKIERLAEFHIAGYDASFTNSSLLMVVAVVAITAFLVLGSAKSALVPGRWQSMTELAYEFIANMVHENAGTAGMKYFPWVFSIFMFVLFGNLLGMIPYSFTFTSHIVVTFALAAMVFVTVTLIALFRHGLHFFGFFFPHGAPVAMAPLIVASRRLLERSADRRAASTCRSEVPSVFHLSRRPSASTLASRPNGISGTNCAMVAVCRYAWGSCCGSTRLPPNSEVSCPRVLTIAGR